LDPEGCRRLACDGAVTRILVSRQPGPLQEPAEGLAGRLGAAMALLPPVLGGAPSQPLDVGRTSRVVQPAQRAALAVRDGGCVFPDCDRPLGWCEAHHLIHWLDAGPTDLDNLALLCRAHHRAVHEGGWRLARDPDGRLTAIPPRRRPRDRRHRPAA
jgi:HNH endonuclease